MRPTTKKRVRISPDVAAEWLAEYNTENYRPMWGQTVQQYARDMFNGAWLYAGDPVRFTKDADGTIKMADGQTRLSAIVMSKTTQELDVLTDLDPAAVDVMDLGRKRSMANILANHGYKHTNILQSAVRLSIDVDSLRKGIWPLQGRLATFPEVFKMIEDEEDIQWVAGIASNIPHKILNRSVTVYTYLTLHKIDPYQCAEFFSKITEPEKLDAADPRMILHRRLTVGHWYVKGRALRLQQTIAVFRAWNAWRNGDKAVSLTPLPANEIEMKVPEPI